MKRGRKIVAVAHCILNVNAKVYGIAQCPAGATDLINLLMDNGYGIIQLPCIEQAMCCLLYTSVNIVGLLATDEPTIDCVLSGTDKDADTAILEAFSLINRATTGAGTLTVQCIGDAPTVAIPITLQVVR